MLASKERCSGCTACRNACPISCISMSEDREGFLYPIIDKHRCINCKICEKICPVIKERKNNVNTDIDVRVIQNKREDIRSISTAGGFVEIVFNYVFNRQGVAYGCGYDNRNNLEFFRVSSIEECIDKFIFGSKYVASNPEYVFKSIKEDLSSGKTVAFVGLPCQVGGLKAFLNKEYSNLYTIDLTCYGVPSPKLYRLFLDYCEAKYKSKIKTVYFRDKTFGYSAPSMSILFDDGKIRGQNSNIKSYLRGFFKNLTCRPSCYNCYYKTVERVSDFTIGDCKNIGEFHKYMDDDKGTTVVYLQSDKGKWLFNHIQDEMITDVVDVEKILDTCGTKMNKTMPLNRDRKRFFSDIDKMTYIELINKYISPSMSEYMANIFKSFLLITGLNNTKILKKLKGR